MRMKTNYYMNPCGEIALEPQGLVMPWAQVHWMNHIRVVKQKLPPYTTKEINNLIKELEKQHENKHMD